MLKASETLKAKSCSILRQLLKQYHPLAIHADSQPRGFSMESNKAATL
jgi:hypothetical protein